MEVEVNLETEKQNLSQEKINELKLKVEKRKNILLIVVNIILILIIVVLLLIKDDKTCTDLDIKEEALEITPVIKEEEKPKEKTGKVIIYDENIIWSEENELKIFENPLYGEEMYIAPESSNTYKFIIKNDTEYDIQSQIEFSEINPYQINMMYRLKTEEGYIIGSEEQWVKCNEILLTNVELEKDSKNTYYLEWKWFESDNDTKAGTSGAEYSLFIKVNSNQVID